ncbi:MAG TPA: hypothetical protein GXZ28_08310 [Clostridiales bacterium]|nr:hypothetical protein [Clostridiales bacterium]
MQTLAFAIFYRSIFYRSIFYQNNFYRCNFYRSNFYRSIFSFSNLLLLSVRLILEICFNLNY